MDTDAPPTHGRFISRLHPKLQIALRYKAAAIKATDVEKSLRLYALARKYRDEAASEHCPQAAFLLVNGRNYGGWGAFEPVVDVSEANAGDDCTKFDNVMKGMCSNSEYIRLVKLRHDSTELAAEQVIQEAYAGDIIPICAFGAWYNGVPDELIKVLEEFGLCSYDLSVQCMNLRKYVTGLEVDLVAGYACESVSKYMHLFKVIGKLLQQISSTKYTQKIGQIFEIVINSMSRRQPLDNLGKAHVLKYTLGYFSTNTVALLRDEYYIKGMLFDKITTAPVHCLVTSECAEFYQVRVSEYRRAACTWLLCARGFVCKDIAIVIAKMVFESRLEF